ncbi:MAG: anti-sigma factor [Planctomycetota bacterium]
MTAPNPPSDRDAMLDLLADAVAFGLEPDGSNGSHSRDDVLSRFSDDEVWELEHAAAAVALACASDGDTLPDSVRLRCSGAGRAIASGVHTLNGSTAAPQQVRQPADPSAPLRNEPRKEPLRFVRHDAGGRPGSRRNGSATIGWLAAAACLVVAATAWWPASSVSGPVSGPVSSGGDPIAAEQRMDRLVETAADLTRWDWNAWDPAFAEVTGEVVWSEAAQEGYMVLTGMPANDPSVEQYQLWVVDASRGTPLEVPPVDGGVFDVADDGRVVIPVRCAILARDVVAFAVTIEQPGGVVVSDRTRPTVIAQAPAPAEG